MAEFDETDLRPFSGIQRPMTGGPIGPIDGDGGGDVLLSSGDGSLPPMEGGRSPQGSGRPMTTLGGRPTTTGSGGGGRRTAGGGASRPVTSFGGGGSRPVTSMAPEWMFSEPEAAGVVERPKTGYKQNVGAKVGKCGEEEEGANRFV